MSTGARAVVIGLVVLVIGAAGFALWNRYFERKQVDVPLPPIGEAAYNPLYALKLALLADGVQVRSSRRLTLDATPLAPGDSVLLLGDMRALPEHDAQRLLDWIASGGHLIVQLPEGSGRENEQGPLLQALGVAIKPATFACANYADTATATASKDKNAKAPVVRLCGANRILVDGDAEVSAHLHDEDYDADYLVRIAHGSGSVDVVVALGFLQHDALEDAPAAALARQLLAPNYKRGTVHLVYDADMPPLWRIVLERGWMAWLPLLLALLGWLFWRTQRRGPLRPSPALARRSLVEHVQASGEHLHRYGRGHLLHGALRELFEARLRRRDPYAASLQGTAQRDAIAARTGMAPADVDAALRAPVPFVAADLRLRIAKLNALRQRL